MTFDHFFLNSLIYLLAALGLCCCADFSLVVVRAATLVAARGLLTAVASRHRAQAVGHTDFSIRGSWALERRLNSCGTRVWLFLGMWDRPGSGMEPVSPALAGGSLSLSHQGNPDTDNFEEPRKLLCRMSYILNLSHCFIMIRFRLNIVFKNVIGKVCPSHHITSWF